MSPSTPTSRFGFMTLGEESTAEDMPPITRSQTRAAAGQRRGHNQRPTVQTASSRQGQRPGGESTHRTSQQALVEEASDGSGNSSDEEGPLR